MDDEVQVLAAMLTSRAAIEDATAIIDGSDFADYRHEAIFDAITRLDADGKPVTPLTVHDELTGTGIKANLAYIHEISSALISAASAEYHAQQVRSASMRARV